MSSSQQHHLPWRGLVHLLIVYVVWGSTYLAMRVTATGGFPPLHMTAGRTCIASIILVLVAKIIGFRVVPTLREAAVLAGSGVLLWLGGNGMVAVAEKHAASGFAALIIGSTPVWPAIFEAVLDRRRPTWRLVISLFIGFCGLAVLVSPMLRRDALGDLPTALLLIFASFSWACGTTLQQRRPVELPPLSSSAWQQFFGGIVLALVTLLSGEPSPEPTSAAWLAWGFLLVFGSLISFTSFIIAVRMLPMQVVMTYAYVNPVTAVVLGRIFLGERITPVMIAGMALIIAGVAGIFHERFRKRRA